MGKGQIIIFLSIAAAMLVVYCGCFAEMYDDPDLCFSTSGDGWISDIMNIFEIRASDSDLYSFDAFSAIAFAGELDMTDFAISRDPLKPYDRALVFLDNETFAPVLSGDKRSVRVSMSAILDPEKLDAQKYQDYAALKYSVIDDQQEMRRDILIWANTYGKQIPIDGIFWLMNLPGEYDGSDIAKYGAVLNYLTQYVYETKQSSLNFKTIFSDLETDETGRFRSQITRQITGLGYSIGLIVDPSFVFLAVTDSDAVLFRNSESVIEYYNKLCGFARTVE